MTQGRQAAYVHSESTQENRLEKGPRRCHNRCFFCYVKGLPAGLRSSLYLRDDDPVHSFLFGSYVTLTNLSGRDWKLLKQRRLSPLRVSVHTTDLELRRTMLGNPQAPDILEQLARLGALGIRAHAQVVLCPGVNDGPRLEKTIVDLARLDPIVESVALVPVGLSLPLEQKLASRPGPWPLARFTPRDSQALLDWAALQQRGFRRSLGRTFLHLADEFYLLAERPTPEACQYDGFPQYQNGVGMVRTLLDEWARSEARARQRTASGRQSGARRVVALCGALIAPMMRDLGLRLSQAAQLEVLVVPVENRLFGPGVTVSGLLGGQDLLAALPPLDEGDVVLLPRRALEASGRLFLDSVSLDHFRRQAQPGRVALVERAGDLGRALWRERAALPGGSKRCAA